MQIFNYEGTKTLVASTYGRGIWNYALSPDYTNVISNSPQTVFPTQTATFNGTLTAQVGYASPVNLSCTGTVPATCTLAPTQIAPTATYTVTARGGVGDYSFIAHAVGTDPYTITHDATVTLHVVDFNLTAPSPNPLSVGQGGTSGTSTFQATAAGSFSGAVTLSCSAGLPAGAACVFSPSSSVSPTSSTPVTVTLTVTAAAGTPLGGPTTVTISAMATGAPAAKTQTFGLTVTAAALGFTWTDTGNASVTVLAGQSASYTFSAAPVGAGTFNSAVSFGCSGLPALTSCGFSPASIAAGAGTTAVTLTISTTGPNLGTESRSRVGAVLRTAWTGEGARPHTSTPGTAGGGRSYAFILMAMLGIVGLGRKRRGKPRPHVGIAVICLGLGLMAEISCGGVAGSGNSTTDFAIAVTPTPNSTGVSPQAAIWNGTLTALNGYRGNVTLSCMAGAPGTCTITPPTVVPATVGAPFTVTLGNATAGTFNFTIQGTDGTLTHATPTETLTVTPPGPPVVTVSPASRNLFADEAGNSWPAGATQQQFSATVSNSTNQSVTWAVTGGNANGTVDATGLYTAPAAAPNPATVTVTATSAAAGAPGSAFVTVAAPTAVGTSQITVTATAVGGAAHGDVVTLIVQ